MVNKVTLIGRLGADPEVRRLENGAAVASVSVATNESYKDKSGEWKDLTEWHRVVMWRNLAERAETQLKKGSLIYLEGKLQTRKWTDKDGKEQYTTEVVARMFRSLEKREGGAGGNNFPSAADEPVNTTATVNAPVEDEKDDDLPF